ncbi:hypothetical protein BDV38DRAFT_263520 [Aspergillus pseudotamarii]|uniref:Uncharacterized protein n=1 Tax=Aspergillus pseudotamarii TaxID=132259 RepID=A0A5N6SAY0_ASPPS|nr:uncharacterized protein BDV38DRAFT_263520 [Aspergillus pseudotamarii]KAE8131745.1 hypothetical protein BDV38DRAFT_263520 [Aspergillus pseudotamarii]
MGNELDYWFGLRYFLGGCRGVLKVNVMVYKQRKWPKGTKEWEKMWERKNKRKKR